MSLHNAKAMLVAFVLALGFGSPAGALTFSFTDAGGAGMRTLARTGYQIAADYWSSVLTDPVTVNLAIAYQPITQAGDDGLLGETFTYRADVSAAQAYAALAADRTTPLDIRAVGSLPPLGTSAVNPAFGAVSPIINAPNAQGNGYIAGVTRLHNDGSVNNSVLSIGRADAKALDITAGAGGMALDPAQADATVTLSSTAPWDFDPTDGVGAGRFDSSRPPFTNSATRSASSAACRITTPAPCPTGRTPPPARWKAPPSPRRWTSSATIRKGGSTGPPAAGLFFRSMAARASCSATRSSPPAPTTAASICRLARSARIASAS